PDRTARTRGNRRVGSVARRGGSRATPCRCFPVTRCARVLSSPQGRRTGTAPPWSRGRKTGRSSRQRRSRSRQVDRVHQAIRARLMVEDHVLCHAGPIIPRMSILLAFILLLAAEQQAGSGTIITADEIAATLKQSTANNVVDQPVKAAEVPG